MTVPIPTIDLAALRAALDAPVLAPGDDGYDAARQVFNAAIDRRPAAIVRPDDARDVAIAVRAAREAGLPVAVRGGGHGFAGHGVADDALLLDLRPMRRVDVDPSNRTAWAQAGATAGAYTAAAFAHGLTTGFGDTGDVGIAGLTLGGGIGWLVRKHGMTIDHLLAVELVTPDGELREVDAEHEPDLFWALRGGGGNFGVVTRLRYRLEPIGTVLAGMLLLPADAASLVRLVEIADAAPEELTIIARVMPAPPLPFIPVERHGQTVLLVGLAYAGDPADGERAVAPIRRLGVPIADLVQPMPYPQVYEAGGPERAAFAVRSALVDDLDAGTAEALLDGIATRTVPMASAEIRVLGGAMARVADEATAFAHRRRRVMLTVAAMSMDPGDEPALEASVAGRAAAAGLERRDAYVNYAGGTPEAVLAASYPPATAARLAEVKRRYDPDNVFRSNHNIASTA